MILNRLPGVVFNYSLFGTTMKWDFTDQIGRFTHFYCASCEPKGRTQRQTQRTIERFTVFLKKRSG